MAISNSTYSRGRQTKVRGREERARQNKSRYSQTDKWTIKISKNQLEFVKTRTLC